jgi:hypothetical protein
MLLLKPDLLRHVTFDLGELTIPRPLIAAAVEAMGGAFVREGEPRPARFDRGPPWVFVIGQATQPVRKRSRQVCHLCCAESALN